MNTVLPGVARHQILSYDQDAGMRIDYRSTFYLGLVNTLRAQAAEMLQL